MALGELGNFTSSVSVIISDPLSNILTFCIGIRYAFAPASVVAPLGTVALIANCFIAPFMLHERFRKKDIVGIGFSILGAVTIVLSAKSENKSVSQARRVISMRSSTYMKQSLQLTPRQFLRAVSQTAFIVYTCISLGLIV